MNFFNWKTFLKIIIRNWIYFIDGKSKFLFDRQNFHLRTDVLTASR